MRAATPISESRFGRMTLGLMTAAFVIVVIEGLSYVALALLPQVLGWEVRRTNDILEEQQVRALAVLERTDTRETLDSALGWIYRPGFVRPGEAINSKGARSTREYSPHPKPGTFRITGFGDSFMYGNAVEVADAWSSELERRQPQVEVLNFGVGGYGTDQAFLRYLKKRGQFGEDLVLIGFAPVSFRRSVNVYRRFISDQEWPLVKPRFVEDPSGAMRLLPNPLPTYEHYRQLVDAPRATVHELGRHDFWYEPLIWSNRFYDLSAAVRLASYLTSKTYKSRLSADRMLSGGTFNTGSEAFNLQVRILAAFVDSVSAFGAEPRVVIFPDRASIERFQAGAAIIYAPLVDALRVQGIEPFDLMEAFAEAIGEQDADPWFAPSGHYSASGNRVVAEAIASILPVPKGGPR